MCKRKDVNIDDNSQESWEDSESSEWEIAIKPIVAMRRRAKQDQGICDLVKHVRNDRYMLSLDRQLFTTAKSVTWSSANASFISTCHQIPLTEVTSQIYLGSFEDAKNEEELRARNITHIISLIGPSHSIAGVYHKHSPMSDYGKTDLEQVFKKLWPFIEESQQPENVLFVHCMSGQNRSATLVIGIIMRILGKSLKDAFRMVMKKRPMVQINKLYAKQLSKMELELFGRNTVPKDWMEIKHVDMKKGCVRVGGDELLSKSILV
jgi:hypothetical protein